MCCNLRVIAKNLAWSALIFALLLSVLKGLSDQKIIVDSPGAEFALQKQPACCLFVNLKLQCSILGQEIDTQMRAKKLCHSVEW